MKWLCYLVLLLFVAFTFLKVRAVRGTVHERYHFHHVFHSPNAKRRRKHSSRFMQQIVNNFVGDDGPVAPVLNVHLEVPSPPENAYDRQRLEAMHAELAELTQKEALDYSTKLNMLQQAVAQHMVQMDSLIKVSEAQSAEWAKEI